MKRYSNEFKKAAIERVRNGETQIAVAKSLGISDKTLNHWCVKAKEEFKPSELSMNEELVKLRKTIKEQAAEIEFLKKAAAYFAKQP